MAARSNFYPPHRQISSLLTLLSASVLFACLFAYWTIHYYSPTATYYIESILLNPELAQKLSFEERDSKTGKRERRLFDHIELLSFQKETREWKRRTFSLSDYKKLYEKIAQDKSLKDVSEQLQEKFYYDNSTILTVVVKKEHAGELPEQRRVFQEVQFLPHGDYYRVQLYGNVEGQKWAYFYHPNIYDQVQE